MIVLRRDPARTYIVETRSHGTPTDGTLRKRWRRVHVSNEGDEKLSRQVAILLKEYDSEMADKVRRTLKQWNNVIRDHLRNEMGLRLTVGDEAQAFLFASWTECQLHSAI